MEMEQKTKIYWGRFAGWVVLLGASLWFFIKIYHTIMLFTVAFLIAYILYPLVYFVSNIKLPIIKKKIPWFLSILIVYFLLIGVTIVASGILIPTSVDQINNIIEDIPSLIVKIQNSLNNLEVKYERLKIPNQIKEKIDQFIDSATTKMANLLGSTFNVIGVFLLNLISKILFFILSLVIALFILSNIENLKRGFYSFIPPNYQDDVRDLLAEINKIFGNFLKGNLILILINGTLTYTMLYVVILILRAIFPDADFPFYRYALVTSVIAGATYFIPYLGCSLSVVVGLALAYLQHPTLAYTITIGLIVLLTNQSVDTFIRPKVLGEALGVNTLFIVFSALAGNELLGIWGLIIGIPVGVMLVSIIRFIYNRFLAFPVSEDILEPNKASELTPQLEGTEGTDAFYVEPHTKDKPHSEKKEEENHS